MVRCARIAAAWSAFRLCRARAPRIGSYKCYQCRGKFTVKVGTVFEADIHFACSKTDPATRNSNPYFSITSNKLHSLPELISLRSGVLI